MSDESRIGVLWAEPDRLTMLMHEPTEDREARQRAFLARMEQRMRDNRCAPAGWATLDNRR